MFSPVQTVSLLLALIPLLAFIYIRINDAKLTRLPPDALAISPHRWTDEEILETYAKLKDGPKSLFEGGKLPPKTGRRYIVTGGVRMFQHKLGYWLSF